MTTRTDDTVRARGERWRVGAMVSCGDNTAVHLTGLGPHNAGELRVLLTPFDRIEPCGTGTMSPRTAGSRCWQRCCRAAIARHGGWTALRSAESAVMDVLPFQIEPVLAILRGEGCRLLLADGVGLGKTLQAGLIVSELLRRGAIRRALLLTPAGLRDQWAAELARRFGLATEIMDLTRLHDLARTLPPGSNAWSAAPVTIASIDFVKRPEVLPLARARGWDLLLVDEAHLVAPGTDRYDAVSALANMAAFVVLVTATPHNGDRAAYEALRALGSQDDPLLVYRRTRADVQSINRRRSCRLAIAPSRAEERMHAALSRYARLVVQESESDPRVGRLLASLLLKRALSSPEALRQSVARRLEVLERLTSGEHTQQMPLPLGGEAGQVDAGEVDAADEAPIVFEPALRDAERERRLLRHLLDIATQAALEDSKLRALSRLLRRLNRRGEAAIVFTEYRDTLRHLHATLPQSAVLLHGGLRRDDRREAVETFTSGRRSLLLATDAGAEGLNLHARCRCVIHLELPWSPVRLEQRTGRVDRIGQRRVVHAIHLLRGRQYEADVVRRLDARVEQARADIGGADPFPSTNPHAPAAPATARPPSPDVVNEAERILLVRRLRARERESSAGFSAPVTVGRARGRLRAALAGRVLMMASARAEDGAGRPIATLVCALLIQWAGPAGSEPSARSARLRSGRPPAPSMVERLVTAPAFLAAANEILTRLRSGEALRDHRAFWQAAARRAGAIERALAAEAVPPFQPGLFDRRAERQRRQLQQERRELSAIVIRRRAEYEQTDAGAVALDTPVLLTSSRC